MSRDAVFSYMNRLIESPKACRFGKHPNKRLMIFRAFVFPQQEKRSSFPPISFKNMSCLRWHKWVLSFSVFLCELQIKKKIDLKPADLDSTRSAGFMFISSLGNLDDSFFFLRLFWHRLGQSAAQKAVLLRSDVGCIVHSCASLSAIPLTSWWQTSQRPVPPTVEHRGFHSHMHLAAASPLSVILPFFSVS